MSALNHTSSATCLSNCGAACLFVPCLSSTSASASMSVLIELLFETSASAQHTAWHLMWCCLYAHASRQTLKCQLEFRSSLLQAWQKQRGAEVEWVALASAGAQRFTQLRLRAYNGLNTHRSIDYTNVLKQRGCATVICICHLAGYCSFCR